MDKLREELQQMRSILRHIWGSEAMENLCFMRESPPGTKSERRGALAVHQVEIEKVKFDLRISEHSDESYQRFLEARDKAFGIAG